MIKTVRDALANLKDVLERASRHKAERIGCWSAVQINAEEIRAAIRGAPGIDVAVDDLLAEARAYTGGPSISATLFRSVEDDERLFEATMISLFRLRDVARDARAEKERVFLGAIDETQVPDPF